MTRRNHRIGAIVATIAAIVLLALPLAASAQTFTCGALPAADCTLIQTGLANLARVRTITFEGLYSQNSGMGGIANLEIVGEFSGVLEVDATGSAVGLDVTIAPASLSISGLIGSGTPSVGAARVVLANNVLYFGSGADANSMTWMSYDLTGSFINRTFSDSTPMYAFGGTDAAWTNAGTMTTPAGLNLTVYQASSSTDDALSAALGDLSAGMGSMGLDSTMSGLLSGLSSAGVDSTLGGMLSGLDTLGMDSAMSGLISGLSSAGLDSTMATMLGGLFGEGGMGLSLINDGTILVDPSLPIVRGFSYTQTAALDMAGLLGDPNGGGAGSGSTTAFNVMFTNFDAPYTFTAPTGAVPLPADVVISGSGMTSVIANYYVASASETLTGDMSGLLGGLMGGSGDLSGLLGGTDTLGGDLSGLLGGLLGGMGSLGDMGSFGSTVTNPVTVMRAVETGETITGTLVSGQSDGYTLTGQTGQTVQIALNADFDTYLEIRDAAGATIANNDDFNGLNSQINFSFPAAGTYTIVARGYSSTASGPYTLTIGTPTVTQTRVIGLNEIASGNLVAGARDTWTFVAQGGEALQINMDADFDTYLELYGPAGSELARNDDTNGLNAQINFVIPNAGTYTIIARSFGSSSGGPYTLTTSTGGSSTTGSTGGSLTGSTGGSLTGSTGGSLTGSTGGSLTGGALAAGTPLTCGDNAQSAGLGLATLAEGQSIVVTCPPGCTTGGPVWGSRFYTDDSSICVAAVHAGVISTAGGTVLLTIAPGQQQYTGSALNGVTTSDWGSWSRSFTVARAG